MYPTPRRAITMILATLSLMVLVSTSGVAGDAGKTAYPPPRLCPEGQWQVVVDGDVVGCRCKVSKVTGGERWMVCQIP